jgi:glycosyltransferase involved in cell wall biosynthesis
MQILKELNLSPENSLFIDDNSHEIDLVKNQIPKIDCFQIKPNKQNISIIDNVVNFLSTKLTNEDKNRTKFYNQEIKRNIFKNKSLNLDKYIKDLNINLIIRVNSKKNIDRLSQLTQRTNQFNTTTARMTSSDLKDYLDNKTNYVFELSANDKFGDYGIIGIAFIKTYNNQKAIIENFLFSCRAIGREMEDYFIIAIIKFLESKRINRLYINFTFIGDGKEKQSIIDSIPEKFKSYFTFTGKVEKPEEYLIYCDIGILLSKQNHSEGLSNSIMEYMAAGLPVICTKTGGNLELVEEGKNGFLIEHENKRELIHKIEFFFFYSIALKQMGLESKSKITENFEIGKVCEKYFKLYTSLV